MNNSMRTLGTVGDLTSQTRLAMVIQVKLTYSIYEAKAKLSELLRAVRQGKRVTITDRGREVARVVPIAEEEGLEDRMADLVAAGILSQPSIGPLPGPGFGVSKPSALARFLQERD